MDIKRIKGESLVEYNARLKFVESHKDKIDKEEIDKLSKIWANIKFRKCKYNKTIYLKIIDLDPSLNQKMN